MRPAFVPQGGTSIRQEKRLFVGSGTLACRHNHGQVFCDLKVNLMMAGSVPEINPNGLILKEKICISVRASTPIWTAKGSRTADLERERPQGLKNLFFLIWCGI